MYFLGQISFVIKVTHLVLADCSRVLTNEPDFLHYLKKSGEMERTSHTVDQAQWSLVALQIILLLVSERTHGVGRGIHGARG